jgi:hypothetical protein
VSGFALLDVGKAVYSRLKNDAGIIALVSTRVHDVRPQESIVPCINFGRMSAQDYGTKSRPGQTVSIGVQCWSTYEGRLELLTMGKAVHDLFHEQPLTTDGVDSFIVRCQSGEVIEDGDGGTRQITITLSVTALSTT